MWMFIIDSQTWAFVDEILITMKTFLDVTAQIASWQGYLVRFHVHDSFLYQGWLSSSISVERHFYVFRATSVRSDSTLT